MKLEPISKLVSKTNQIDPINLEQKAFSYIDISSVDKETKVINCAQVLPIQNAPSRARKEIQTNDILVSTVRPNLNGVAIVPVQYDNQIASTGFCILRSKITLLDPYYLFYFTQTDQFISRLTKLSIGAGYPAVSEEAILETEIPLPPLPEQHRISAILQKADRLRRLRRYARQLSESFLQSVFLEMFGDPETNPEGWKKDEIGNYLKVISGHGFKYSEYSSSGIRLLQIANVSFQEIPWDTVAYLPSDYANKYPNLILRPNDLVMALNRPILGDKIKFSFLSINDCPSILYQRVGKFEIDNEVNKDFFFGFMQTKYFYNELKQRLAGSDQPYINPTELVKLIGYFPPRKIQDEYSLIAQQSISLKRKHRESERQGELLFQSLLQRAFQGEL